MPKTLRTDCYGCDFPAGVRYAWSNNKEFDKAIADYNDAIRLDPKDSDAYYFRGLIWTMKGEYDKSIANFDETIRLNPKDADAYFYRGHVWETKGNKGKAEADFAKAKELGFVPKFSSD